MYDMRSLACMPAPTPETPPATREVSDATAIQAVIGGDRAMFEIIVRRYNTQLYRVGMAYLHDHAQVEDAMQNTYLKAFLNLSRFHGHAAFSTWLTRIMINECLMIHRRRKQFILQNIDDPATAADREALHAPPTPEPLHNEEIKAVLEHAVQTLPRTHRAVYLLREVQQLSTAETAQCLGLSEDNVKVSLHRAREGLKARLLQSAAGVELFDYPACHCDPMTAQVMHAIHALPTLPASELPQVARS